MKALAWTKYGEPGVLEIQEFKKPFPKDNEVLIKIHASAVTAADCRLRAFKVPKGFWLPTRLLFGLIKPRIPVIGMDISGEIDSVGKDVKYFKKGDRVYGTTGMRLGGNAEYVCLPENAALVRKPSNMSYEQAAAVVFGGLAAIYFLGKKATIQSGCKILINGASGAVGTASIQLAKYFGAEVTGVCSTSNVDLITSLGAKRVVDYTVDNFAESKRKYDVILDAVGNLSLSQGESLLKKQGKLILINTGLLNNLLSVIKRHVICGVATESKEALDFLRARIEAGDIKVVIDKIYPLKQAAEAHRYVDMGYKKGAVVISMNHSNV